MPDASAPPHSPAALRSLRLLSSVCVAVPVETPYQLMLAGYDNSVAIMFVTVCAGPPCAGLLCDFMSDAPEPAVTTSLFVLVRDHATASLGLVQRSILTNVAVDFNA